MDATTTVQPRWTLVARLGDADPLANGGYFVYRDATGRYPEEAELVEPDGRGRWTAWRFALERCTDVDGVLSDNPHHPGLPAWFADSLESVACAMGMAPAELRAALCSADPVGRALGYRAVGEYHGFDNLDHDPLTMGAREARARYDA